jgi:hypothetical protein
MICICICQMFSTDTRIYSLLPFFGIDLQWWVMCLLQDIKVRSARISAMSCTDRETLDESLPGFSYHNIGSKGPKIADVARGGQYTKPNQGTTKEQGIMQRIAIPPGISPSLKYDARRVGRQYYDLVPPPGTSSRTRSRS